MKLTQTHADHITREALRDLIELSGDPCISIYMPAHRNSVEIEQDSLRLKNLVRDVESSLIEAGQRRPDIVRLLEPVHQLVEAHAFWQHQSDGLAIFCTAGRTLTYRLPIRFEELAVAGGRPHIKPLLPLLTPNGHFYLVALSQDQVRFFQGTRFQIGEIELEDTPSSLAEAMRFDEFESQLQFQTMTGAETSSRRAAIFHGHSDAGDSAVVKENVKRFLRLVDEGICDHVRNQRTPLVLAGVDSIQGLYKEAGQYPTIVEEGVSGNPEMLDERELHERAWPLVEPLFRQAQQSEMDRFMHLAGTRDARASSTLKEIVSAAYFRRVETLFTPMGVEQWGAFDPELNQVHIHDDQQLGDIDLFDFAAIHTLLNGGSVYAMQPARIPGRQSLAAIFRYVQR